MKYGISTIREDFYHLALISSEREGWSHNSHYHDFLLSHVPQRCGEVLDVGCGKGTFTRLLAKRAEHALGIDLSPEMIRLARERTGAYANVAFEVADVMTWAFPVEKFDCVASLATMHHLSLGEMLVKMRDALRVGGVLLVLDLYEQRTMSDFLVGALALPVDVFMRLSHGGRLRMQPAEREAWAQHGAHEEYLSLAQVRRVCARVLPGARLRRHLLWRYSIVWTKS